MQGGRGLQWGFSPALSDLGPPQPRLCCWRPCSGLPLTQGPDSPADLMELMMIQSSQMHQVLMNSLALSALTALGPGPSPATAQVRVRVLDGQRAHEEEQKGGQGDPPRAAQESGMATSCFGTAGLQPKPGHKGSHLLLSLPPPAARCLPPPPPSATGTVGANVPPAAGKDASSPCPSRRCSHLAPKHAPTRPGAEPPLLLCLWCPWAALSPSFLPTEYYNVTEERP
uniref:DUF4587 domain-containing protein n=1 Tax=Amazona collaria TaxID=241587 RepID=A0A8B9FC09_9PSIT